MTDLVERQAVIDAIHLFFTEEIDKIPTKKTEDGEVYVIHKCQPLFEMNKALCKRIKELPSVPADEGMTIDEAIIYMRGYQNKLKTSVSLGLDKDIEAYNIAINALEQGDVLQRLRKRISDLYNTDVTYDNGDYNTMDTPTLDKVLEYFDSEVNA